MFTDRPAARLVPAARPDCALRAAVVAATVATLLAPAARAEGCGPAGGTFLNGRIHGSVDSTLAWAPPRMACAADPDPEGGGLRINVRGPAAGGITLSLVLGIAGTAPGDALPTNVTVVVEDEGAFFSTAGRERCWTDLERHEPARPGPAARLRVAGRTYCVGALPAVRGRGSVTLGDIEFSLELGFPDDEA
jgi:hypothetical protein